MNKNKKKKGWYLEIKHKEIGESDVSTPINYDRSIEVASHFLKDTEKITSKALNLAIKDGIFYKKDEPQNIIVHLNNYNKGLIIGRYVMKFNKESNELVGHYNGWEYYTVDGKGSIEPFKYSYSFKKVFMLPIIFVCVLCLILLINIIFSSADDMVKTILTFLAFYLMIVYSVMILINKDIAKHHFIRERRKNLLISTFIFEASYWIAALITILNISSINGVMNWGIFLGILIPVYAFLIFKFALSMAFDIDKMKI
ncbi:hypothetical protein [Saccharococcus sp. Marseille-Q5394]|uniref:hypothetical protein n=1 Tax=Saccharococcus sp. Marseille-Q5394 TaxID=2972778 RepID=UPI0021C864A1|nr:hypothetical protein [Saccharococcus sp. Marseille-Q5394]